MKKILKPLFVAVILVVLFFALKPEKNQECPFLKLEPSQNDYSQGCFADPTKKPRPEYLDFLFVQKSYLQAAPPSITVTSQVLGALVGGFESREVNKTVVEYLVEPGDNLWSIATNFDISFDTLLWANNLNKNSVLQFGQKLIIPPVSGVIHHVKSGDTVSGIAEKYKAEAQEIVSFNGLSSEADIFIGDILVIPDGTMPPSGTTYVTAQIPVADSYFICPISPPCRITQGLHWYNAIDFSHGKCGEPIYAAAGGTVQKVKLTNSTSKWAFGGIGNHITILHPNGVVTAYGHILTSLVSPGDEVSQGQIIALMGGQPGTPGAGMSTGCHVHFGVRGASNPFAR